MVNLWSPLQSPNRRPLDFFFGRFYAHVETHFILITSWDFDPYRFLQSGDNRMEVQPKRTCVRPRLVHRYGMFVRHTRIPASAMPTITQRVVSQ